jgi:hypothetical protein
MTFVKNLRFKRSSNWKDFNCRWDTIEKTLWRNCFFPIVIKSLYGNASIVWIFIGWRMNLTENLFSNSFARALCIFGTSRGARARSAEARTSTAAAAHSLARYLYYAYYYIKEGRPRANCAESSLHARTHKRHKRVSDGENSVRKREEWKMKDALATIVGNFILSMCFIGFLCISDPAEPERVSMGCGVEKTETRPYRLWMKWENRRRFLIVFKWLHNFGAILLCILAK